jgi:hypothetical protein
MTEDEILEHLLLFGQPPYAAHVWDYYWWTANAFVTQPAPLSSFPARFPEMPGS